ncbi:DUF2160 domain-containing protein [Ancylobacter sp. SL191]|jgi:predicted small integral membrane protein|uniref:DUF2160 domain-containing protein n=1 Tax=Ancylobacter sp. SL191 TaxID=2995166 RepID=UPI00226EB05C|nr:DUF2160 domain-containing protein [Ancylobacter sp. SL191]WAC27977.1 DUF2160 domain-containing protein [Ancylobacter sp. SL191]
MDDFSTRLTENTAWMAWTWQTGVFFALIATVLIIFTVIAVRRPERARVGVLRIPTTRGDRLFITLLGSAFINLAWLALVGPELGWALALCLVYALAVFRLV